MSKLEDLLKQMGLEMEYEDFQGEEATQKIAKIHDPKNPLKSAHIPFEIRDEYKHLKTIDPLSTYIPKEWRKKGLATELYKELEELTGAKIMPGTDQTEDSFELHDRKGYGKQFGIDEKKLQRLLTPSERLERETRKEALSRGFNKLGAEFEKMDMPDMDKVPAEVDYDYNLLKGKDRKNIGTLFDKMGLLASKFPTGKEAANYVSENTPKFLSKVRSISPMLLKGAAVGAGGALSLAAEASDSPEAGDSIGQAAFDRDSDAFRQERQIESSTSVPDHVKLEALKRFRQNKLPY